MAYYRNRKLLDAARDRPCVLCGSVGTTVSAHSNALAHGKGMGLKAPDDMIAWLCQKCHDLVDGRVGKLTLYQKRLLWALGYKRTRAILKAEGLIK